MAKQTLKLSVHDLVDFLLRAGDIDNRIYNEETMQMGSKIHAEYQSQQGVTYVSEYFLSSTFDVDDTLVTIQGRADGVILSNSIPVIDEIKSTVMPLSKFYLQQSRWHLGQAQVYALMYAREKNIDEVGVKLTYISQLSDETMIKNFKFSRDELEVYVTSLIQEYLDFQKLYKEKVITRDKSVKNVTFPYENYRAGQEELSNFVSDAIANSKTVFAEAPTGIGKTMSTLYPAIKSLRYGKVDKIFYLTAKGTGREMAFDAMTSLYRSGFIGRDSQIIAKDKICFCPGKECNPDQCPFAKAYYDKIKGLMLEGIESDRRFDTEYVTELARKNCVCPHELQLDLSLFADVIVCDLNYFFDPVVKLQRYFGDEADPSKFVILHDEAHNLVDRGRSIFSQKLIKKEAEFALLSIDYLTSKGIKNAIKKLIQIMDKIESTMTDNYQDIARFPEELLNCLEALKRNHQTVAKKSYSGFPKGYLDFYLNAKRFYLLATKYYGDNYQLFAYRNSDTFEINLFCLDASSYLNEEIERVRSVTLFSATLSPMEYYQKAITGLDCFDKLALPSPFPRENFNLMIAPKVSVRYKDRDSSYAEVACYLKRLVESKIGNYFIYFPSYEYMYNIAPYLDFDGCEMLMQNKDMSEDDKATFLSNFRSNPTYTTVGLLVLGGAFSEGIDMVSDRLIGVAIIGIGFPQINHENDLIRAYQDEINGHGFSFAYIDPGMNKVMQAVGRLIRSETDKGCALLIDDRYLRSDYRNLFAQTWENYEVVLSSNEVSKNISLFYKK